MQIQYCLCCGENVLMLGDDAKLADMPRRRVRDGIMSNVLTQAP